MVHFSGLAYGVGYLFTDTRHFRGDTIINIYSGLSLTIDNDLVSMISSLRPINNNNDDNTI